MKNSGATVSVRRALIMIGAILSFISRGRDYILRLHYRVSSVIGDRMFQCWLYGFQFKQELKKSQCRIMLHGSSSSVTFEGPIISAEVQASKVEKDGLGLIISSHTFKRILSDDEFNVSVEILDH